MKIIIKTIVICCFLLFLNCRVIYSEVEKHDLKSCQKLKCADENYDLKYCKTSNCVKESYCFVQTLLWIWKNDFSSSNRLSVLEEKVEIESENTGRITYNNLIDWIETADKINESPVQFSEISEEGFCITGDALKYLVFSWRATIAERNGKHDLYEKNKKAAENIMQLDWYEGIVENDETRQKVDKKAKNYIYEFSQLEDLTDVEPGDMTRTDFMRIHLLKPFCSEPPIIELIIDELIDELMPEFTEAFSPE